MAKPSDKKNVQNFYEDSNSVERMIDYLENILTRQLSKLKQYDIDGAFRLAEEAGRLAEGLRENDAFKSEEFAQNRQRINSLYKEICLVIASQRDEVSGKLKSIRKGIKTLQSYVEGC